MKKKTTLAIVIAILLVATIGLTYAFFSTTVTGEGTDNIVEAGTLSLHFEDGSGLVTLNNAIPGQSVEKKFSITNTGTLDADYSILWKELFNEILLDELVFTLECTSYKNGVVDGTCEGLEEAPVPIVNTDPIKKNIHIDPEYTHSYKMTLTFKEMNKDQNYNQGKRFYGTINIEEYFVNPLNVPKFEDYQMKDNRLVAKFSDAIGITHYAIAYTEESIANLLKKSINSVMRMSSSPDDLEWIEVEKQQIITIDIPIEDYNVVIYVKNSVGNITMNDLTPQIVVNINPNEGTHMNSTGTKQYNMKYKETLFLSDPTREGYTFDEWEITGEKSKISGNQIFTAGIEDTTVKALWNINSYKLTINPNGGTYNNSSSNTIYDMDYQSSREIEDPIREGYTFTGWELSSEKAQLNTKTLIIGSEDATLTATWQVNNYPWIAYHNKMNTDGNGYTLVDADTKSGEADFGSQITPDVNSYDGFTSPNEHILTIAVDTNPPTKNVVNYNYERNKYALTIDANKGEYSGTNPVQVYYEQNITINNPTRVGYNFNGWTKEGVGTLTDSMFTGGIGETTLTATWTPIQIEISFNTNGGNSTHDPIKINYDENIINLPEPSRNNYTFEGWFTDAVNGTLIKDGDKITFTENKTLYAHWEPILFEVTLDPNEGSVDPTKIEVSLDSLYGTLPKPTRANHTFEGWYTEKEGGTLVDANTPVTNGNPHTLYAHWKKAYRGTLVEVITTDNTIKNDNANMFAYTSEGKQTYNGSVTQSQVTNGLYRTTILNRNEDTNGDGTGDEVLYFRGIVENNYLVFANYCWRIVRTNEDGSVKLRYGGNPTANGSTYRCPQTGTSVNVGKTTMDVNYGNTPGKTTIDNWYKSNIANKGENITSLISDTPFCNDQGFGVISRLSDNKNPQYKCPSESYKFSVSNKKLTYPVALLTADEVAYAGGVYGPPNLSFYLYTGEIYWTMTPYSTQYAFVIDNSGYFYINGFWSTSTVHVPVISIVGNAIVLSGNGQYNNPYIVSGK